MSLTDWLVIGAAVVTCGLIAALANATDAIERVQQKKLDDKLSELSDKLDELNCKLEDQAEDIENDD